MASSSRPSRRRRDINDFDIAETDPTGQYVRYNKVLSCGSTKRVYMGLDRANAIEVAWSKSVITEEMTKSEGVLKQLYEEGNLLMSLDHDNILKCYKAWEDRRDNNVIIVHMITELFTGGNLFEYVKKHNLGGNRLAIKNFARQILEALDYLHSQDPPIIHRDIKGEKIFVDGDRGRVKLSDFEQARSSLTGYDARIFTCTPMFMAPDLLIGSSLQYDQKIDIYSFGMSVVQLVSQQTPYNEYKIDEISEKVRDGVRPLALDKVTDPEVRRFIERCITHDASGRPTARDLLNDAFLARIGSRSIDSPDMELVKESCNRNKDRFELKGTKKENSLAMTLRIIPNEARIGFEILETDSPDLIKDMVSRFDMPTADQNVTPVYQLTELLTAELKAGPPPRVSQQNQDWELVEHEESEDEQDEDEDEDEDKDEEKTKPRCFEIRKLSLKDLNPCKKS